MLFPFIFPTHKNPPSSLCCLLEFPRQKKKMASATPATNPKSSKNVYRIGGIEVEFPYQPYAAQMAFMSRVISTLDRAERDGHCHALLESPTGTGKSLSLLCSIIAWQQSYKTKNMYANLSHSKPNPKAMTDPKGHGGGFVPEETPSSECHCIWIQFECSSFNLVQKLGYMLDCICELLS